MKLWVGHDSGMHKLKVPAVTLTFDLAACFLHATHRLVISFLSNNFQIPPCMMKLWVRHESGMPAVTLTFDLATWLLHPPHCLVVVIILPNNFKSPPCMMKLWVGHNFRTQKI